MTATEATRDPRIVSAEILTAAIESGRRDAFLDAYTRNAVVWHNTDGREVPVEEVFAGLAAIHERATVTLDVERRDAIVDGFVQVQRWHFSVLGGNEISFPSLFVALVDDGRIARLDEYVDSAALVPLTEALAAPAATPPRAKPA